MKYQMMLKILFLLLARKKVSAKCIADRYEISLRTVYRYIDELSLADVPIYNIRGRNGGYAISDSYKIPANFLTEEESEKIDVTEWKNHVGADSLTVDELVKKLTGIEMPKDCKLYDIFKPTYQGKPLSEDFIASDMDRGNVMQILAQMECALKKI